MGGETKPIVVTILTILTFSVIAFLVFYMIVGIHGENQECEFFVGERVVIEGDTLLVVRHDGGSHTLSNRLVVDCEVTKKFILK
tara:strand:- start:387 stop:638 length:252 start_codon:yes stop_codon:yes gene_type:complete